MPLPSKTGAPLARISWGAQGQPLWGSTAYWYALPAQPAGSRPDLVMPRSELAVPRIPGAIEGEAMKVVEAKGIASPFDMTAFKTGTWSGNQILWWRGAKPGDKLVLSFDAPKAGRYRVAAYLTKSWDYGIHQLSLNGQKAGEPVDLWNKTVVPFGPVDLGVFELQAKDNRLAAEVVGTHPFARPKNFMFGLDAIVLSPE